MQKYFDQSQQSKRRCLVEKYVGSKGNAKDSEVRGGKKGGTAKI